MEQTNTIPTATPEDIEKNKTMAVLSYFIFFLPLLTDAKDSTFAKFHANQALMVFILGMIGSFLSFVLIGFCVLIFWFILVIMGIMNASQGKMERLPVVGGFDIIK